jgi:hypothetical protein
MSMVLFEATFGDGAAAEKADEAEPTREAAG